MTIRYEINPPKINQNFDLPKDDILKLLDSVRLRISQISSLCDGIHLTDSVLGIPRISPLITGELIRKYNQEIKITISMRVRDKNLTTLRHQMDDAVSARLNGVLILKGDASPNEQKDSGLIPSNTVKYFYELGYGEKIDILLSLPSNPDFNKIQKKIDANPVGFITQVIHSIDEVSRIVDRLKPYGFKIIPCVLLPSDKNAKSAQFLKLDWSNYKDSVEDFIKQVHQIAGDVLITSPNDFNYAKEILGKL